MGHSSDIVAPAAANKPTKGESSRSRRTPVSADVLQKLAAARAGSPEAVRELFESCRSYLLLVANCTVGEGLQARVAASDLLEGTYQEAAQIFDRFAGQSEEDLLNWFSHILERQLERSADCSVSLAKPNALAGTVPFERLANDTTPQSSELDFELGNSAPHTTRLGRFEILREIGRGGHGVVFLARDPKLNRLVALKVPQPEALLTPSVRRRFVAEGQAAAVLTHPNIVTVYEAGEIGPICYLAQEYVGGPTLGAWLRRQNEPVAPVTAACIIAELADGVDHAHARGIIHRDLKPGNILLADRSGQEAAPATALCNTDVPFTPKVSDFGIAGTLESDGNETVTGTVLGTPAYMPPEQASGKHEKLTCAVDVYGLGAILYELLTGEAVFRGETNVDTVRLVISLEPTAPRKLRKDIPSDLNAVCLKCLEKDPKRRYQSAFALAQDLRRFLAGEPTNARALNPIERMFRWCRRNSAVAALIGVSVAALAIVLGVTVWSNVRLGHSLDVVTAERERAQLNEQLAVDREYVAMEHIYATDIAGAQDAWSRGSVSTAEEILANLVPEAGRPDMRSIEWPYLNHLVENSSRLLEKHAGKIGTVCYSQDGKNIASGSEDGTVHVRNAATGEAVREWVVPGKNEVNAVTFSPDGQLLAAVSDDGGLRVWSIATGALLSTFTGHSGWVADVCFSPDGTTLATAGSDMTVRLWDLSGKKEPRVLKGHRDVVRNLRFLLDGTVVASTSEDRTLRLWSTSTGDQLQEVAADLPKGRDNARPTAMAVSLDGKTLAVCWESTCIRLWHVTALPAIIEPARQFEDTLARSVTFSRDGKRLLIGTSTAQLNERDIATRAKLSLRRGHRQQILAVAASPINDEVVTASRDGELRKWTADSGKEYRELMKLPWKPWGFCISPDGRLLVVTGPEGQCDIFDAVTGKLQKEWTQNPPSTCAAEFFPSTESLLTFDHEFGCRIYETWTGRGLHTFPDLCRGNGRAIPSSDGTCIFASTDTRLESIDLKTHASRASLPLPSTLRCLTVSPDGHYLALGGHRGELWLCDQRDLHVVRRFEGHSDGVTAVCFSPAEPLICSTSEDLTARIWNLETGEYLRTLSIDASAAGPMYFSPDGRTVVGRATHVTHDRLCTWNVNTGRRTLDIRFPNPVRQVVLAPDGRRAYAMYHARGRGGIYVVALDPSAASP